MNKSFKYRLNPTFNQAQQLSQMVGCARFIYNWGLNECQERYKLGFKTSVFELNYKLVFLKKEADKLWLNDCSAQVLQQSLANLGEAFKKFFLKKAKYPRFKKKGVRDSIRIPQFFEVLNKTIKVPKMGLVKYIQDRPIEGIPKHLTISRSADSWYVSVCCEMEDVKAVNLNQSVVGVDAGVTNLFTTFDGKETKFYHHQPSLKKLQARVVVLQKQLSHKLKGNHNRWKLKLRLQRAYERVRHVRKDTLHKLSTLLAKNHGAVVIENLRITNMTKSAAGTLEKPGKKVAQKRSLNRAIMQQAWGTMFDMLFYKCKWYGSLLCLADPAYSSQTCPVCKHVSRDNRKTQAKFVCMNCKYTNHADAVAAINLRASALPC